MIFNCVLSMGTEILCSKNLFTGQVVDLLGVAGNRTVISIVVPGICNIICDLINVLVLDGGL